MFNHEKFHRFKTNIKMTLLEKAAELYSGILEARPKTDPMYLEFQQFVTTHFGHAGTVAMREIESKPVDYKYKNNPVQSSRQFRSFVHPNAAPVQEPEIVLNDGEQTEPIQPIQPAQTTEPTEPIQPIISQNDILTQKAANIAASRPGKLPGQTLSKNQIAVIVDNSLATTENVQPEKIDPELAKTMKAKAFGEQYKAETMREWLENKGTVLTGKESPTQLAKIIIDTITTTAE